MTYDLTGKRAIVTGASRGLGAAIAKAFEAAGAEVLKPTRKSYDLSVMGRGAAMVCSATNYWDCVDVVVNCAGIVGEVAPFEQADLAMWGECLQVNLLSPVEVCAFVVTWMVRKGVAGSIINISGGGATSPRPNYSAYATAKCGLVRFSETLACEVEQYGIRVNCVAPGLLNTAMGDPSGDPPERAAQLVTWLASDASRPITGRLISAKHDAWDVDGYLAARIAMDKDEYTLRRHIGEP